MNGRDVTFFLPTKSGVYPFPSWFGLFYIIITHLNTFVPTLWRCGGTSEIVSQENHSERHPGPSSNIPEPICSVISSPTSSNPPSFLTGPISGCRHSIDLVTSAVGCLESHRDLPRLRALDRGVRQGLRGDDRDSLRSAGPRSRSELGESGQLEAAKRIVLTTAVGVDSWVEDLAEHVIELDGLKLR